MSDHATKAAEAVAHAMSRRGFLGRVAQVAGGLAAGMGGVLATRAIEAGEFTRACPRSKWCSVDAECRGRQVCDYGCCVNRRG